MDVGRSKLGQREICMQNNPYVQCARTWKSPE